MNWYKKLLIASLLIAPAALQAASLAMPATTAAAAMSHKLAAAVEVRPIDEMTEKEIDGLLEKIAVPTTIVEYAHEGNWEKVAELAKKPSASKEDLCERSSARRFALLANRRDISKLLAITIDDHAEDGSWEKVVGLANTKGTDVNAKDSSGNPPLLWAADEGQLEVVQVLIQAGANVNIRGLNNSTALMSAAEKGALEIVKVLVQAGADVNAQGITGWTALMLAVFSGHLEVVRALIKAGADVNIKTDTDFGYTAFDLARTRGNADIAHYLYCQQPTAQSLAIKSRL